VPLRRNRDFQLLWGGQAVSLLGSQTSKVAYPLLVLAMTGSPAKAGHQPSASRRLYRVVERVPVRQRRTRGSARWRPLRAEVRHTVDFLIVISLI
jgi:hypothetical protein